MSKRHRARRPSNESLQLGYAALNWEAIPASVPGVMSYIDENGKRRNKYGSTSPRSRTKRGVDHAVKGTLDEAIERCAAIRAAELKRERKRANQERRKLLKARTRQRTGFGVRSIGKPR